MNANPLSWLSQLGAPEELRALGASSKGQEANCHVHLPPNFSAFSGVDQAIQFSAEQNVAMLGINNYYDYSIYDRFQRMARAHGVFPLFGTEIIVLDHEMAREKVRVNDPKNPGKIYLCGKAIARYWRLTPKAEQILGTIVRNDRARMAEMVRRISAHLAKSGISVTLSDDSIIQAIVTEYSVSKGTVTLQERHVARAFQQEIFRLVPLAARKEALTAAFGAEPKADLDNPVKMQDEIRNHLMKAGRPGYVDETFVGLDEAIALILELGGVPCYPILADGADPITDFEATPEELAKRTLSHGLYAVEFIPTRNALSVLTEYAVTLRRQGLVVTAGTEHNSQSMGPIAPACKNAPLSPELKDLFWEGACVMAAHQYLVSQGLCGYVNERGELNPAYPSQEERIAALRTLGEGVIQKFNVTPKA